MGDLQFRVKEPNGDIMEEDRVFTPSDSYRPPDPSTISEEIWRIAEEKTCQQVLCCIHPTLDSEEKRKDVTEYVSRVIRCSLGCEVFPFGSVPLKTYLPDGDIDLTALSSPSVEESLARDVLAVLKAEEQNENAEYVLKDTQFIDAEIDRLVGKDHLFKRSIILIKAWCYYESRILGAHHGLISTYALEILVLYIFHLFNSSLKGPLAVLYRFLDYYSQFDWDNYCISLNGPVCKSSLPDFVVEKPGNREEDLMLSEEFLRNCVDMFSVPSRELETNLRAFPPKHLNIIDPLKENNNLGRSVHRGNFYRIRSAFKYGARKLGRILLLPRERIGDEIKNFFRSTLERHGLKYGDDMSKNAQIYDDRGLGTLSTSHTEAFYDDEMQLKSLDGDIDDDMLRVEDKSSIGFRNELAGYSEKVVSSQMASEITYYRERTIVSEIHHAGDANDLPACRSLRLSNTNEASGCSPPSSHFNYTFAGQHYLGPQFYFTGSSTGNEKFENGTLYQNKASYSVDERTSVDSYLGCRESHLMASNAARICTNNHDAVGFIDSAISSLDGNAPDSISLDFRERGLASIAGDIETLNLSDLRGDYDSHIRSLLYGQCLHGYGLSAPVSHNPPLSASMFQNRKPWDTIRRSMPLKQEMNGNGVVPGPPLYSVKYSTPFSAAFGMDERHKARGIGTYFPNTNYCSSRWRPSQGRGRNHSQQTPSQLQKHVRNSSLPSTLPKTNLDEEGSHELTQAQSTVVGRGKSGSSGQSDHVMSGNSHGNETSNSRRILEFGSFGPLAEGSMQLALSNSNARGSSTSNPAAAEVQNLNAATGKRQGRIAEKSINLKNEDDFPPLAS